MKKPLLFILALACISLVSCTQNDCTCVATQQKKAASSQTYPIYDWGGSCSSISANDIPAISDDGEDYYVNCSEL